MLSKANQPTRKSAKVAGRYGGEIDGLSFAGKELPKNSFGLKKNRGVNADFADEHKFFGRKT
jgi:hypothetical protein